MLYWQERAQWIWLPAGGSLNQYVEFRRSFTVSGKEGAVTLFISCDSHYAVSLNGTHLPLSQYGDYPEEKVYDSLDVTALLHAGENVLTVTGYHQGEDCSCCRCGEAGLLFALAADTHILACSDGATVCRLSPTYQSGEVERISGQLSFSFRYDARREDGWQAKDYCPDGTWANAAVFPRETRLTPRPIERLCLGERRPARIIAQGAVMDCVPSAPAGERMQAAFLSARRPNKMGDSLHLPPLPCEEGVTLHTDTGDGVYLLVDLGGEEAGLIELDLTLPQDATVLVGFGEHTDDLRLRTAVGGRQFAARCEGKQGDWSFTHYFKRIGARYLMLYVLAPQVTVRYAGVRPTDYPLTERPPFTCTDSLHNRIAQVSRRTLRLCMHEHYEDCPWREQALYALDSRNQMLCGYYAFGETRFAAASLRLLAKGLREDGLLELCAPARVSVTIPSFSLAFIQAVDEYVTYAGDLAFATELLPTVQTLLATFLDRMTANGLVPNFIDTGYWNFYEWRKGLDGGTIFRSAAIEQQWDAPLQGFLLIALNAAANLCERLGETEKAAAYRARHAALCAAVEVFWEDSRGVYATTLNETGRVHYCQLTQALLLCGGAVPTEKRETVLARLAHDTTLIPVSMSCSIYKYEALLKAPATYGAFVRDEIATRWGAMLFRGASSFWETEVGADDFEYAGSLCHAWSAVPLVFYHRYVLGEQLDGTVSPVDCALTVCE